MTVIGKIKKPASRVLQVGVTMRSKIPFDKAFFPAPDQYANAIAACR
jgi:hypothetical protein